MILGLEPLSGMFEVTATLSNAFLVAMMPQVSDVAGKLELPLPQPITYQQVVASGVTPYLNDSGEWSGFGVKLTGGWVLGFHNGYMDSFVTTNSYYALQNPDEIPRYVGTVRMTQAEAVQMARMTIEKLNIPLEKAFADLPPRVQPPEHTHTGIVPRYRVQWDNPRGGSAVDMEINADAKRVERITFGYNPNLRRSWPDIGVKPTMRSHPPRTNPEYANKLLPVVFEAVDEYAKKLGLAVPLPLTTNHVARFSVEDNGGWPHCELELTNGWRFIYRNSMVNGFYAPDSFFDAERRPFLVKDYVGKWNMTKPEAIALIGKTLAKLNYPTDLIRMDFPPQIHISTVTNIPRYNFWWWQENEAKDDLVSKIEAEVDADKRQIKSLYFDHKAFWNKPPPIDVPLSLPAPVMTNGVNRIPVVPSKKAENRTFKPPGISRESQSNSVRSTLK